MAKAKLASTVMVRKILRPDGEILRDLKSYHISYSKIFIHCLRTYPQHLEQIRLLEIENAELKDNLIAITGNLNTVRESEKHINSILDKYCE